MNDLKVTNLRTFWKKLSYQNSCSEKFKNSYKVTIHDGIGLYWSYSFNCSFTKHP